MQCRKYFETLHEINLRKKEGYNFFYRDFFSLYASVFNEEFTYAFCIVS